MQDGIPARFSLVVRNHLQTTYPGRWIGRGRRGVWPSNSPDFNPLDFFFWGHLKSLAHETSVATVEDLKARIIVASANIANKPNLFERVRQFFILRCQLCSNLRGRDFDQLL
ncbi:uncharacterized protein TNCV_4623171 [Trichonephila clavipes]|nr:uncharacterized protein TNCV_4623171 [Trichonephila clavipes]